MNIVSKVRIIADNMRIFIASGLMRTNTFVADIVQSNRYSGGEF